MVWWKAGLSRTPKEFDWNRFGWRLLIPLALVIGGLHCTMLRAQTSAACPRDNLDECARYQNILAGMESNDLTTQLVSLRAASQELDPAYRTLIFGKALKSADLRLRTAGLRYVLASRTTFNVVVDPPVHPTAAQQKVYKQYGTLTLGAVKLDEKTDEVTAVIFSHRVNGSIIRGGFELGWPYCRLHLAAGEEDALKGTLRCQYPNEEPAELKASIELG